MRMSVCCWGIGSPAKRPQGYAPGVVHTKHQHRPLTRSQNSIGHVAEITGHVPEFGSHDAETVGHALPKYALKQHEIANLCPTTIVEVSDFARRRLKSMQRRPRLIQAFSKQAEMAL
jgi:hypothetical protein